MTPFCIKFWTGAPSQAYFAGYDGTTYTHCAPVEGDPTKLLVQFDDHHLPIGDLKFQIAYHFTVADFPTSVEDEVINQADVIIEQDGEPAQVMLDFNGETAPEIEFSLPAYANEAQRIANEQERIAAEEQRVSNEQQRISNEEDRISAEESRQEHEQQRIRNEETRIEEFAGLKADAIAATGAANDAATLANEKAALAQQKADYAQAKGDYAKAQGDTALADHERAESDHATAASDHTQASSDHDRAESDHSQAAQDHDRAESDHTRAESDHAAVEVYVDSLGAFDISSYHATGSVLAKYADLTAALGTNGANIPDVLRKGGMSVKFVQSSDNKYVQYRLMSDAFTTDTTQWQGVDDVLNPVSKNLIENKGVASFLDAYSASRLRWLNQKTINPADGNLDTANKTIACNDLYQLTANCREFLIEYNGDSENKVRYCLAFFNSVGDFISRSNYKIQGTSIPVPPNTVYVKIVLALLSGSTEIGGNQEDYDLENLYISCDNSLYNLSRQIANNKNNFESFSVYNSITQETIDNSWIRNSNGSVITSNSNKVIKFKNIGYKLVRIFAAYSDSQPAAIAFYSGDLSSENYIASKSVQAEQTTGAWFEAEVPDSCKTIAITNNKSILEECVIMPIISGINTVAKDIEENNKKFSDMAADMAADMAVLGYYDNSIYELGNILIQPSGLLYSNSTTRARTKKDSYVHLKVGDRISFGDYTDLTYYVGWQSNSVWNSRGWLYKDFIAQEEADYVILARHSPEIELSSASELFNKFYITRKNGKQDQLVSNVNIKTVGGESILGPGNININPIHNYFFPKPLYSIAHRGYNYLVPECTSQAFLYTKKYNFDFVEFDIQFTSDGIPVLMHDVTINRVARNTDGSELSEPINIRNITYEQALSYDYGLYVGQKWAGLKLLTLQEALELAKRLNLKIMPEAKYCSYAQTVEILSIIQGYDMLEQCILQSLSYDNLSKITELYPSLKLLLLSSITQENIDLCTSLKTRSNEVFIGVYYGDVSTMSDIKLATDNMINVVLYTPNNPSYIINTMPMGVFGVISDQLNASQILIDNEMANIIE